MRVLAVAFLAGLSLGALGSSARAEGPAGMRAASPAWAPGRTWALGPARPGRSLGGTIALGRDFHGRGRLGGGLGFLQGPFWPGATPNVVNTVVTQPERMQIEFVPHLPVVVGGYRTPPVGAPTLYVIDSGQASRNARVVSVASDEAVGPDGPGTPRIVRLRAE